VTRVFVLLLGALAALVFALLVLIVVPSQMLREEKPSARLEPYTPVQLRGREVYVANGCVYCHTQQVRDSSFTSDVARGWGSRPSVPADYFFDEPHLMGTMRTGPDLLNVGGRLSDPQWHLVHLYQPRALVPWSIMPAFPFLFKEKPAASAGERVLNLPKGHAPPGKVVVTTPDADALVAYLLALKRDYPLQAQDEAQAQSSRGAK
jgi:cytochrome c oxidase cbb3-type subunit II